MRRNVSVCLTPDVSLLREKNFRLNFPEKPCSKSLITRYCSWSMWANCNKVVSNHASKLVNNSYILSYNWLMNIINVNYQSARCLKFILQYSGPNENLLKKASC